MKFSNKEKKDLIFAGIMISLAFAILLSGGVSKIFNSRFYFLFLIAFFTAGVGFLLHELMHKYIAQSYNFFAEFKAFYGMLLLAILLSFFGFIIAAPGAVFIRDKRRGFISQEKNGKISLAGPMTNLVLAVIFLVLILFFGKEGIFGAFLNFGLRINSLLAAFNMIPAMPFDGSKVFIWNKKIYTVTLILGVGLFILSWIL